LVIIALVSIGTYLFFVGKNKTYTSSDNNSIQTVSRPILSPTKNTISQLHVSGNHIVNDEGQTIRLRGVNFEDPFLLDKETDMNGAPMNHFSQITTDFQRIKAMGANIVRLPVYPGYYFLVGGDKYLSIYVDRMIDLAEQNGLYAIISYHVIGRPGGWYESDSDTSMLPAYPAKVHYTDTDMAVAFWNKVATRYGQRKHVLFEMYNEPVGMLDPTNDDFTWTKWRPTGQLLITTIRQHSDNIILGPGPKYTGDLSDVPTNPYTDSNLVYVAHIYPNTVAKGDDQITEWERRFGFLSSTYPVIVSEWGFHNGAKDETVNGTLEGFAKPLLDYLDQKNISWVAYVYHPPDDEPPMLESDWVTLNEFGQFVAKRLQL
jgi:aryl-phospho-beta-D-glucosidase BglC (GH1 family)